MGTLHSKLSADVGEREREFCGFQYCQFVTSFSTKELPKVKSKVHFKKNYMGRGLYAVKNCGERVTLFSASLILVEWVLAFCCTISFSLYLKVSLGKILNPRPLYVCVKH